MRNKTIFFLIVVFLLPCAGIAGDRKNKKTKKETPYQQLFKGKKCETVKGIITIHKMDDKVYFEIPLNVFGKEMLLGSTITEITSNMFGSVGEKPFDPIHVVFLKDDSATVSLREVNSIQTTRTESYKELMAKGSMPGTIESFDVKAYTPDSSAVVVDVTRFLISDKEAMAPFSPWCPILMMSRDIKMEKPFKNQLSHVGKIKSFEDNFSVQSLLTYEMSIRDNRFYYLYKMPFTVVMTRSFLVLPETPMRPRMADPRIGIFVGGKYAFNEGERTKINYYATRWRLEPKDKEAYQRGELVEPIKPIVYYVDNAFPREWKKYVKKGIEEWQAAFEKIGFKNAIVAKDFPENDPDFDPDNLKYSCVRYSPSPIANAMGPSWTDPRSGEIIQANISVYHNLIQLVQDWRFLQTAPADPSVRKVNLDEEIVGDCIRYVISHEVGHTLGFMHNMAASSGIPTDSLRSPSFTQKYGTTYSIMDYARNNYVAQPGDAAKGVRMTPPVLGLYDYYLIQWLYTPLLAINSAEEEVSVLDKWISEKSGDPVYRYGKQQILAHYDPSSFEEDLGDDPVKSAAYGVQNLKYVLQHLNEWTASDDKDFSFRQNMYNELLYQYIRYMNHVLANIGGVYLNERYDGDARPSFAIVMKEKQQRAVRFMLEQLRDMEWIDDKGFQAEMPIMGTFTQTIQDIVLPAVLKRATQVAYGVKFSEEASPYTPEEYFNDIYEFVFAPTLSGKDLTGAERKLQMALLSHLIEGSGAMNPQLGGGGRMGFRDRDLIAVPDAILVKNRDVYGLTGEYDLNFLQDRFVNKNKVQTRFMDSQVGINGHSFWVHLPMEGYSMEPLYLSTIQQTLSLLKSKVNSGSIETRQHYELLIHKLEQALGK